MSEVSTPLAGLHVWEIDYQGDPEDHLFILTSNHRVNEAVVKACRLLRSKGMTDDAGVITKCEWLGTIDA